MKEPTTDHWATVGFKVQRWQGGRCRGKPGVAHDSPEAGHAWPGAFMHNRWKILVAGLAVAIALTPLFAAEQQVAAQAGPEPLLGVVGYGDIPNGCHNQNVCGISVAFPDTFLTLPSVTCSAGARANANWVPITCMVRAVRTTGADFFLDTTEASQKINLEDNQVEKWVHFQAILPDSAGNVEFEMR